MIQIQQPEQLRKLDPRPLQELLKKRLYQLHDTGDLNKTGDQIWLVEIDDDLINDYLDLGKAGLFSDTFDENDFGDEDFGSPLEFIEHHPEASVCELLCQMNDDASIIIFIPYAVLEQASNLQDLLRQLQGGDLC